MRPAGLLQAWNRYWFSPAPLVNLAVTRIFAVAALLGFRYVAPNAAFSRESFEELHALPAELYDPLPALHMLVWPVDWWYRPTPEVLEVVFWIAVVAGCLALIGLLTNLSLAAFTLGSVFLETHAYSYGNFHHTTALLLIALGLLTLSPAGRVLSVDAALGRWWRRRGGWRRRRGGTASPSVPEPDWLERKSAYARWPLLLIGWLLVLVYLSAAKSKVGPEKGLDWTNGYTLQFYMLRDGIRWDQPLGIWLSQFHGLAVVLAWCTLLFEGTFALALLGPAWVTLVYVAAGLGLHGGIYLTMAAPFFGFMALYSALLPWDSFLRSVRALPERIA